MDGISHLTLSRCLLLARARAVLVDDDKCPLNMVGFVVNVVLRCRRSSHLLHGLLLLLLATLAGEALPQLPDARWETFPGHIEHEDHDQERENEGHGACHNFVNLHGALQVISGCSHC